MSKLSQLKQEAYQAGKKRDWGLAVSIYEQILEIDKSNPMVINEMGDLCLKAGETPRAVCHFLAAAARYRSTGLLNNAVAIYKKILRYDTENLNAHWYLAETRASQGLLVEGRQHAIHFLDGSDEVSGDIKEIFLKRCAQMFELYADSQRVMEKLLPIFRSWNMNLEAARVQSLLACFSHQEGGIEVARQACEDIRQRSPEVCNYPEFQRLQALLDPAAIDQARQTADVNSISLDNAGPAASPGPGPEAAAEPASAPDGDAPLIDTNPFGMQAPGAAASATDESAGEEDSGPATGIPTGPDTEETSFASVAAEIETGATPAGDDGIVETDEEGCFELSLDEDDSSFEDLVAQAASGLGTGDDEPAGAETELEIETGFGADPQPAADDAASDPTGSPDAEGDRAVATPDDAGSAAPEEPEQKVDLLAQILQDEGGDKRQHEDSQVAAITSDIGAQVGGGEQDAASLYEMGMVYLDMGLFDQAVDSFGKAARDEAYALRGLEMTGITLLKAQRPSEAVDSLQRGREIADPGTHEYLGLSYHLAQAHEQNGQESAALDLYQEIAKTDPGFLDVKDRLAELSGV